MLKILTKSVAMTSTDSSLNGRLQTSHLIQSMCSGGLLGKIKDKISHTSKHLVSLSILEINEDAHSNVSIPIFNISWKKQNNFDCRDTRPIWLAHSLILTFKDNAFREKDLAETKT